MILNFWDPAFRSKIAQTLISIDSIEPPGTFPRNPRKWCQEVLLRPHLHTRRGPGWRELNKLPQINIAAAKGGGSGVRVFLYMLIILTDFEVF